MQKPLISVLVVAYAMPRQLLNTVYSLSALHQRNVVAADYEIVVVENSSQRPADAQALLALGGNVRHFYREESSASPAAAINFGLAQCRGRFIGLMIDGARMLSPRVIEHATCFLSACPQTLLAVPSYNLGRQQQHHHLSAGYGEVEEMALLSACRWQENGYRLFDVASLGDANANGYLNPLLESNCYFASADHFRRIGGADERFDLPGGGSLNLHLFRQLGMLPGMRYVLLPGEGTFHQFHGGITTSEQADREAVLESHRRQLHSFWDGGFHALRRQPELFGAVPSQAQRYLKFSSRKAQARSRWRAKAGQPLWPDDVALGLEEIA